MFSSNIALSLRAWRPEQVGTSSPLPEPPSSSRTMGTPSARRFAPEINVWGLGKINSHTGRSPCLQRPRGSCLGDRRFASARGRGGLADPADVLVEHRL